MSKGTPSRGKRQNKVHTRCRRCGNASFHIKKGVCSACGYGKSARIKSFSWQKKKRTGSKQRLD